MMAETTDPSQFRAEEGMFYFQPPDEAADAFETNGCDSARHRRAARHTEETFFDARQIAGAIWSHGLSANRPSPALFQSIGLEGLVAL